MLRWRCIVVLASVPVLVNSQGVPALQWQHCRGALEAKAATKIDNGSFVVVFQNADAPADLLLTAYSSSSNILWETALSTPVDLKKNAHSITAAGSRFLLSGTVDSAGHRFRCLWLLDSIGQTLWMHKEFFDDSLESLYGKAVLTGSGTIAWLTESMSANQRDLRLVVLTDQGVPVSVHTFGGSQNDYAADLLEKPDNGLLLLATTFSKDIPGTVKSDSTDVLLISTDAAGNVLWNRCFGGTNYDYAVAVQRWGSRYLIAAASRSSLGSVVGHHGTNDYYDVWLLTVNDSGTMLWNNSYGGKQDEFPSGLCILHNNAAVVGATAYSANAQVTDHIGPTWQSDYWTFSIDSTGKFKWGKSFGGTLDDYSAAFLALDSLRYVHVGGSLSRNGSVDEGCLSVAPQPRAGAWIAFLNATCPQYAQAEFAAAINTLNVSFTNLSAEASSYLWSFGDGQTSTDVHPLHQYAAPGTYSVCLIAANNCWSDTFCQNITVCLPPQASFSWVVANPGIQFIDQSLNASAWHWDFGDGATAGTASPFHAYATAGAYTVTLVVANACEEADTVQQTINLCELIQPSFSHIASGLLVHLSANAPFDPLSYSWDFGDGNGAAGADVQYVFQQPGTYNVCLTAYYAGCDSVTSCQTLTVCELPVSDFAVQTSELTVAFTNLSTNASAFSWDFGDGTTATEADPVHQYAAPGNYWVCLIATNDCSADTFCMFVTVTCLPPVAQFTANATELQVAFSDLSLLADMWLWDFGDGNSATLQNPTHTFAQPGSYAVCLIAINSCAADTFCLEISVTCALPEAAFSMQPDELTVQFQDVSLNASAWTWNFGDGNTSSLADPLHHYAVPGTYVVCLTATNNCGTDTLCQSITVSCAPPVAVPEVTTDYLSVTFTNLTQGADFVLWLLGDGNTSSDQNFVYNYNAPGVYEVCLIAGSICGTDTACIQIFISCPPLVPAFSYAVVGDTVYFTDLTSGAVSWFWDFGDGNTSNEANPFHVFEQGNHLICLTVSDGCSAATTCDSVEVLTVGMLPPATAWCGPNPTTGAVRILLPERPQCLRITDVAGNVLQIQFGTDQQSAITADLSAYPAGLYLIQVMLPDDSYLFRIVKY